MATLRIEGPEGAKFPLDATGTTIGRVGSDPGNPSGNILSKWAAERATGIHADRAAERCGYARQPLQPTQAAPGRLVDQFGQIRAGPSHHPLVWPQLARTALCSRAKAGGTARTTANRSLRAAMEAGIQTRRASV